MKTRLYIFVFAGLLILSYYGQKYTVFKYLEVSRYWPPTILLSIFLFFATVALLVLSVVMINKAESKKQNNVVAFWTIFAALIYPWCLKAFSTWFD